VDEDLQRRLRAGDPRAFEELVTTFQHRVFAVAYRMLGTRAEAEEIAQEVFLRAYRGLADFRGEASLSTWLYAIASRLCLNCLASGAGRMARSREPDEDAVRLLPADGADPAAAAERKELEGALRRAIAELPPERRLVVILRDIEGLAYEAIATALQLEPGTVRSRLHRARLELKDRLEKLAC
jgi:RNA polymerase sigma-70 factor (ECF subfamily)